MSKRYLLFGFDKPMGGMDDLVCKFDVVDEIEIPKLFGAFDMKFAYQVYDTISGEFKEHVGYRRCYHVGKDVRKETMADWHDELKQWLIECYSNER